MSRLKNAPDFLGVGMQKAGTSWLYEQLRNHPDAWLPKRKELHFFDALSKDDWNTRRQRRALKNIPESLLFGEERKGNGSIIYMVDNPLFRSFWDNGKLFFVNAIFFRNSSIIK